MRLDAGLKVLAVDTYSTFTMPSADSIGELSQQSPLRRHGRRDAARFEHPAIVVGGYIASLDRSDARARDPDLANTAGTTQSRQRT